MANLSYIEALTHAIKQGFSCEAKHLKSVYVKEIFKGTTAWEGLVEVFELKNHPTAKQAYGWGFQESNKMEFATVLGLPPVIDPETAIRAYIVSKAKN
jgi:hypothetical protein